MKKKRIEQLIKKYLFPYLNDFEVKGNLMFKKPIKEILNGFYFESSGFNSDTFYIYSFIQPLYVPSETLLFTFGDRIGKKYGSSFTIEEENENEIMANVLNSINREGMKIIKKLDTPPKVAKNLSKFTDSPDDPCVLEAIAYSLILENCYNDAAEIFDRIKSLIENESDVPEWYNEILSRIDELKKIKLESPNGVLELLNSWIKQTTENLKLQSYLIKE